MLDLNKVKLCSIFLVITLIISISPINATVLDDIKGNGVFNGGNRMGIPDSILSTIDDPEVLELLREAEEFLRPVDPWEDAVEMARKLSESLNDTVTVKNVSAMDLEVGDVVQYMSQGRYPRYLEVIEIKKERVETKKRGGGDWAVTTSLEGRGSQIIDTEIYQYSKFDYNKPYKNKLIKKSEYEQEKFVHHGDRIASKLSEKANNYDQKAKEAKNYTEANKDYIIADTLKLESIKVKNEFKTNKMDLEIYSNTLEENMAFNTFEGIPIIELKNLKYVKPTLIKHPKHGKVIFGPGAQFLYGPKEGYIGNDKFTFQYQIGKQIRKITINITIQPIPKLNIPTSGGQ
jgi:hypothetical protein